MEEKVLLSYDLVKGEVKWQYIWVFSKLAPTPPANVPAAEHVSLAMTALNKNQELEKSTELNSLESWKLNKSIFTNISLFALF